MIRRRIRSDVLGVLFFGALCGCGKSTPYSKPAINMSEGDGLCSRNKLIDVRGQVFSEQGCEASSTGWIAGVNKGPAVYAMIDNLFSAVLTDAASAMCPETGVKSPAYTIWRSSESDAPTDFISICPTNTTPTQLQQSLLNAMKGL